MVKKEKDFKVIKKMDEDLFYKIKRSLEEIKHGRIREWKG